MAGVCGMELSPQRSVGWEDEEEEEEPLFADDVVNSDDDDPPPLPPPMPPLSQLSQPHTVTPHTGTPRTVRGGGGGGIGDWGDNTQGPPPAGYSTLFTRTHTLLVQYVCSHQKRYRIGMCSYVRWWW